MTQNPAHDPVAAGLLALETEPLMAAIRANRLPPSSAEAKAALRRLNDQILDRTLRNAVNAVGEVTGVYGSSLLSAARGPQAVSDARKIAICLLRRNAGWKTVQIGRAFCRDHSTVIHACHSADDLITTDPNFRKKYEAAAERFTELNVTN